MLIRTKKTLLGYTKKRFGSELYFRVVFRGWECSHSIRSEILLRYWCPDFFSTSSKKYFFDRSKIFFEHFRKSENFRDFFEIFKKVEIFKENRYFFSFKIFDFLKILKIFTFSKIFELFFWSIEKRYFLKKLKKIRTSI